MINNKNNSARRCNATLEEAEKKKKKPADGQYLGTKYIPRQPHQNQKEYLATQKEKPSHSPLLMMLARNTAYNNHTQSPFPLSPFRCYSPSRIPSNKKKAYP